MGSSPPACIGLVSGGLCATPTATQAARSSLRGHWPAA